MGKGEKAMTRAEELIEAYGIFFTHQQVARQHANEAHHRAHRLAHREARRLATAVGWETHNSNPGDYNTKRTAAHNAAGKVYHDTYHKVYHGFHNAFLNQGGIAQSPPI